MSNYCTRHDLLNPCDTLYVGADNVIKLTDFNQPITGHVFTLTISDPATNAVVASVEAVNIGDNLAEVLLPRTVTALMGSRVYQYSIRDAHDGLIMIVKQGRIAAKEVL